MTAIAFDSLKISDDFRAAGFSEPEARALAEKFSSLANGHLVTNEHLDARLNVTCEHFDFKLKEMRQSMDSRFNEANQSMGSRFNEINQSMDSRFKETNQSMDSRFKETRQYVDSRFNEFQYKMTVNLGGLIVAILTFFQVVGHFLH